MTKSWDIKLNNIQYVFGASPGIQLGAALTEPAQPSQVGNIVIASLHGGVGRAQEDGVLRYKQARKANLTIPGEMTAGYEAQTVSFGAVDNTLPLASTYHYPSMSYSSISGRCYITYGQKIAYFTPANPAGGVTAVTISGAIPATAYFSGSAFEYNNELVFGLATAARAPKASGVVDQYSTPGTITISTTEQISYGASARGRAFWLEGKVAPDDLSATLRWAPMILGATFKGGAPYVEYPETGEGILLGKPNMGWLSMVGSSLVMFRNDGVIVAADETGMLSIVGQIPLSNTDYFFGKHATVYQDGLLVPSMQGLWTFDLQTLTLRPASPNYIQGESDQRFRGFATAVGAAGPYAFAAFQQGILSDGSTSSTAQLVRYADKLAVHDLVATAAGEIITDFLPFYDQVTRMMFLYYLVWDTADDVIALRYLPLRLPSDEGTNSALITTSAEVDLSPISGASPAANMTKLWVQLRGRLTAGSAVSPVVSFTGFTIDGNAITLADVTADGAFVVPIGGTVANRLGRELTAGTIALEGAAADTVLEFPLVADFIWVPGSQDACSLKLLVSGEVNGNVASLWQQSGWSAAQALLDLRGTIVTLDFPEGTSWTVFVEAVVIENITAPDGAGQSARVATVQIRRLS